MFLRDAYCLFFPRTLLMVLCALLFWSANATAQSYTTNFPNTESPINEGGHWINGATTGLDWGDTSTTPGQTHDHSGPARFADATALLTGVWGPDQMVQATVYAGAVSNAPEVEIRLRSTLTAHSCSGYEISHSVVNGQNGNYLIIVKWNGPLANYTFISNLQGAQYSVKTGDVVKATIIGNVITVYKNGVQEAQVTDNTYVTGNPGMGFNELSNGTYGYSSFTATDAIAGNAAPTVATGASANPNPVSGSTAALSVLGADDGGEAALTYTWATTGNPPAAVTFSANGTNAAKVTTATFTKAGSYALQATIRDAGGSSVTSSVNITVNQTLSSIAVTPASTTVAPNGTQTFTASANDQFGTALPTQPTFTWAVSGGGAISASGVFTAGSSTGGPFTVTASSSSVNGTASLSVSNAPTVVYQINAGGPAVAPFAADGLVSGGNTYTTGTTQNTTGVANAAPAAVYQSERYGTFTYTFPSLTPNAPYTVRLHFAEIYWTSTGQRVFNVSINGTQVLTNFDIFALAGANKAVVQSFAANANASGQLIIAFSPKSGSPDQNAKSSGIEILNSGPVNQAPTVATAVAANPNPVTATSVALSVLGADDGGEAALTYTWATTGTPPAPVTFSSNSTNAAKNVTTTFTKAGSYALQVTIRDAGGLNVTSSVSVSVNPTVTSIAVGPASATIPANGTQTFVASASDQFGLVLATQPTFSWTVSGGGTISASGVFTGAGTAGGPFTVTASNAGKSGTASVTLTPLNQAPTIASSPWANADPVLGTSVNVHVMADDPDNGPSPLTFTWSKVSGPGTVTFAPNGSTTSANSTATFTAAGVYMLRVTVSDGAASTTGDLPLNVNQTLTSITVTPTIANVPVIGTLPFSASGKDQFGAVLTTQPVFTWSLTGGAATISSSGVFNANSVYTVKATSGVVSGTGTATIGP